MGGVICFLLFFIFTICCYFGVTYEDKHYFLSCTDKRGVEFKVEDVKAGVEIPVEK